MRKKLYLPLLLTVSILSGGCQSEEPGPDYSGLQHISYTLQAINTGSATDPVEVMVYPNPFVDFVNVNVFAVSGEVATIYFSDEKGKYSKEIELPEGTQNRVQVEFNNMPKGIYMCEVKAKGKVSRYRLIKVR